MAELRRQPRFRESILLQRELRLTTGLVATGKAHAQLPSAFSSAMKSNCYLFTKKYQNRAEERAWFVKCLPCKPEDLNLILSS